MLSNIYDGMQTFAVLKDDLLLSFLPLSHTFERTCGYYMQVMTGATVAYVRSIPLLAEDLLTICPTLLISVPRIYERIHTAVNAKLREGSPLKRMLFRLGGGRRLCSVLSINKARRGWETLISPVADAAKARGTKDHGLGWADACAAITQRRGARHPRSRACLSALGLPVVQGYGMTETSPIVGG